MEKKGTSLFFSISKFLALYVYWMIQNLWKIIKYLAQKDEKAMLNLTLKNTNFSADFVYYYRYTNSGTI